MKNKVNLISNFNIDNITNLLNLNENFEFKNYSYNEIINSVSLNKFQKQHSIFFFDIEVYETKFLKFIIQSLKKKFKSCIIIPLIIDNIDNSVKKIENSLSKINDKIKIIETEFIKNTQNTNNNILLNFSDLALEYNNIVFNYKMWHLSKSPFTKKFELFFAKKIVDILELQLHKRKKAIFVDLDDTLWGGTIGELGYNKIKIGEDTPIGSAHINLQKALKKISDTGIILGIISKNYEKVGLTGFLNKKMILNKKDFAGWEINFNPKSENILRLCKKLNIGTNTVIFLDNSYFERNEVKSKLPEVKVLDLPDEPYEYYKILLNETSINYLNLSKEDKLRKKNYEIMCHQNKKISHKDWLSSLKMNCSITQLSNSNFERFSQMQQRINQINLSTQRLSQNKIKYLMKKKNITTFLFSLDDKYTQLGIVASITLKETSNNIEINDFLMSCRALGRNLELNIFNFIKSKYEKSNKEIIFLFKRSEKNQLCYEILKKNMKEVKKNIFQFKTKKKDEVFFKNSFN